jgi:alkylresorcinol/alkylpyrone synthase
MFLIGLGTATPPRRYTQAECWAALGESRQFHTLAPRSRSLLRKVLFADNGIETRHLALDPLTDAFEITPDALASRFAHNAPVLATQAAERALRQARVLPKEIDALLISTCTGYLCPGLTSYVSERLGLRSNIAALDLVGQGCGAALPNLQTASALLAAGPCRTVLSVCVEICSAAFYLDDDPGVLVSACLFGDGAGAVVLSSTPNNGRRIEWLTMTGELSPSDRECLRFEQRGGMLRNILRKEVPVIAGRFAAKVLEQSRFPRDQVTGWILHPGGRNILHALREHLSLRDEDLRWSADVLREHGNLSSPSVLFVLQTALNGGAPGGYWWMSSFGAGFSCYGALWKVD